MHPQGYEFLRMHVDVWFASHALQRQCNERSVLVARWGPRQAASISRTLQEIAALDHLGDVAALPHIRLTGSPSGRMVIGCADGSKITIEASTATSSREIDLSEVREVVVIDVAVVAGRGTAGRSHG